MCLLCFLCLRQDCLFYLLMCFLCILCQISDFLPLRRFYARLRLFLFSFVYVLLVIVRFFRERYKTSPIPSFTILLYHYNTFLLLPQYISITTIFFHHYNIFLSPQYIFINTIFFNHHDLLHHDLF